MPKYCRYRRQTKCVTGSATAKVYTKTMRLLIVEKRKRNATCHTNADSKSISSSETGILSLTMMFVKSQKESTSVVKARSNHDTICST